MFDFSFDTEEKYNILRDIILISAVLVFAFWVNRGIRISGLYMDDLYMWSCYGEQSFTEYVFPLGSTRFRPVYWFAAWLQLGIIRSHIEWIVALNIVFAGITAALLYFFAKKLSGSCFAAFIAAMLFAASRFSYYNISQLLGLMEAMCIVFVLGIAYCLNAYMETGDRRRYYQAMLLYILACFTHERFMVLVPVFIFVLIAVRSKEIADYMSAVFAFIIIQLIRALTIGKLLPSGTGGTEVADTFTLKSAVKSLISEVLYLFGFNAGPEHLSGIPFTEMPLLWKIIIGAAAAILVICLIRYIFILFSDGKGRRDASLKSFLLFGAMAAGCMVSAAVTIRVEMRWIYAPYMLALLILSLMYGKIAEKCRQSTRAAEALIPAAVLTAYTILALSSELYMREFYPNIYLFPNQSRYNSLADETYGKYKEGIFGKQIYILGNSFEMSDFTKRTFFKVYDEDRRAENTNIYHVDSVRDLGQIKENMIVLRENPESDTFTDVTDFVRDLKCEILYGYYRDGWMDEEAMIRAASGPKGTVELEFMYPGELEGDEHIFISRSGGETVDIRVSENVFKRSFQAKPFEVIELHFYNDFYFRDAMEQRGEKRLSLIVNIESE